MPLACEFLGVYIRLRDTILDSFPGPSLHNRKAAENPKSGFGVLSSFVVWDGIRTFMGC